MRRKKRTKTARKKLEEKLDRLWSEIVKIKAGNMCEICGKARQLNSHHIFTRTHRRTRWDTLNGVCLCWAHHTHFAHGRDPEKFRDWIIKKITEYNFTRLKELAYKVQKYSVSDLQEIERSLDQQLKEADRAPD